MLFVLPSTIHRFTAVVPLCARVCIAMEFFFGKHCYSLLWVGTHVDASNCRVFNWNWHEQSKIEVINRNFMVTSTAEYSLYQFTCSRISLSTNFDTWRGKVFLRERKIPRDERREKMRWKTDDGNAKNNCAQCHAIISFLKASKDLKKKVKQRKNHLFCCGVVDEIGKLNKR